MKTVEFNGQSFQVHDWARYITMDDYGCVEVWQHPPRKDGMCYVPVYDKTCLYSPIGRIEQLCRYQEIP